MRACTKCSIEKPLDEFHVDKSAPLGRSARCKECARRKAREWNRENKARKAATRQAYLAVAANAEAKREHDRVYRATNVEVRRAADRAYAEKNSVRAVERVRLWRLKNEDRTRLQRAVANGRRRGRRRQAVPAWASEREISLIYFLASFLTRQTGCTYTVDHTMPLAGRNICGLHVQTNLRVVTASENFRKNRKFDEPLMHLLVRQCIHRFNKLYLGE